MRGSWGSRNNFMRDITDHKVNGLNEALTITADERGSGGASHKYVIALTPLAHDAPRSAFPIHFQNGPLQEAGANGVSNEALLAIVIDRLRGFQSGAFACRDNAIALTNLEESLMWLQKRTRDRMARGVEGTHRQ